MQTALHLHSVFVCFIRSSHLTAITVHNNTNWLLYIYLIFLFHIRRTMETRLLAGIHCEGSGSIQLVWNFYRKKWHCERFSSHRFGLHRQQHYTMLHIQSYLGRFHLFYRPRRPLGRVEVQLNSVLDLGTGRRWGVSVTLRPLSTPGKDSVPIVQEAGWAPGPVWTGAENLAHSGIRSPDLPAGSQSLYRLSYPAHIQPYLNGIFNRRTSGRNLGNYIQRSALSYKGGALDRMSLAYFLSFI
jgi:hypothetical protein